MLDDGRVIVEARGTRPILLDPKDQEQVAAYLREKDLRQVRMRLRDSYSFSTGTQGSSSLLLLISSFRSACSASSFEGSSRAACPLLARSDLVPGHLVSFRRRGMALLVDTWLPDGSVFERLKALDSLLWLLDHR